MFLLAVPWLGFVRCEEKSGTILLYSELSAKYNPIQGIVSRDFGGLQMISMDRIVVPDVPLEVKSF